MVSSEGSIMCFSHILLLDSRFCSMLLVFSFMKSFYSILLLYYCIECFHDMLS